MRSDTPAWRAEPYRILFTLGFLQAWAGVMFWLLAGLAILPATGSIWRPQVSIQAFHSIVQIQGFLMCFATGFIMTAIPRRTGTEAPSALEMSLAILCPIVTTVATWLGALDIGQFAWITLIVTLIVFAVRRFRSSEAERRPPHGFIWIPLSLLIGVSGSILLALYGILDKDNPLPLLHNLGKVMLTQGMFTGLIIGVGSMVLPLITRGDTPPDAAPGEGHKKLIHVVLAAILAWTFWLEMDHKGLAYGLRAILVSGILIFSARLYRLPNKPGFHRRMVWLSAWAVPLGFAMVWYQPQYAQVGLHVTFIAGFALLTFSVGLHVALAHGGYKELTAKNPWHAPLIAVLLITATVCRALRHHDPANLLLWTGLASALYLTAIAVWASLTVPKMLHPKEG